MGPSFKTGSVGQEDTRHNKLRKVKMKKDVLSVDSWGRPMSKRDREVFGTKGKESRVPPKKISIMSWRKEWKLVETF